jgi:hypothetical protein
LVDAGADKTVANKVGLRAGDFGIEEEVSFHRFYLCLSIA